MVETLGVEPTCEDISTSISPSAVSSLRFPLLISYWQDFSFGSFIRPVLGSKVCLGRFPTKLASYPKPWATRVRRTALIQLQMQNYLRLRLNLFATFYVAWRQRLAILDSTSPSKPDSSP